MINESSVITVIISLVGGGGLLGGIYALLKLRPEAGQITVSAAQGAVVVQTGVITNLQKELRRVHDQLAQMEMENEAREHENEDCRARIGELNRALQVQQKDLASFRRMTELARRRSHLLSNAISSFELIIDELVEEMRKYNVPITATIKFQSVRTNLRNELDKLAKLEAEITYKNIEENNSSSPEET